MRKTTEKETSSVPSRFASLSEGEMQQIFTERHSGKNKLMTKWSVSTFKDKLKFFCFKIVKFKTRAFNRKFELKPIPICLIFRLLQKITSDIVACFSHWI